MLEVIGGYFTKNFSFHIKEQIDPGSKETINNLHYRR
jgi:hypothetical protein